MLGPHTVTVIKPGGRDRWGNKQTDGARTDVAGCFWQPASSDEQLNASDTITVVARVFMPATAEVGATDRIEFAGQEYTVHGRPAQHHTPAGPHHYEVQLQDVEG